MKKFISDADKPVPVAAAAAAVNQSGSGIKKKEEGSFVSILLRLAKAKAYDDSGCIIDTRGMTVPDSNVGKLAAYACRSEPYMPGFPEFVRLLERIGVESIPNQNLRMLMSSTADYHDDAPIHPTPRLPPPPPLIRYELSPLPPRPQSPDQPISRVPPTDRASDDGRNVPLPPDNDSVLDYEEGDDDNELEWEDMRDPSLKRRWQAVSIYPRQKGVKRLKRGMVKRRSRYYR